MPTYTYHNRQETFPLTSHSIDQLNHLWRISVPLSRAWITYGEPKLKARWEELQKVSAITAFDDAAQQVRDAECSPMEKMHMLLQKPQEILTARAEVERKLKQNILSYISQGHAHAYGFEAPRKVANAPVYIPKSTWAGKVDWYERTLSHQGLEFVEVRITTNRKGLFITTGHFTSQASEEATRDGAKAIDLIDGERLCDLLKANKLGVQTEMIEQVTVNPEWFLGV